MSMITPALAFCVWCAQERLAGAEARVRGAQARAEALAVELADVQVGARTCQRARVCTFVQTCSGPHIRTHRDTQQAQGLTGTHILKLTRPRTHTLTQARTHTHTHTHKRTSAHTHAHAHRRQAEAKDLMGSSTISRVNRLPGTTQSLACVHEYASRRPRVFLANSYQQRCFYLAQPLLVPIQYSAWPLLHELVSVACLPGRCLAPAQHTFCPARCCQAWLCTTAHCCQAWLLAWPRTS